MAQFGTGINLLGGGGDALSQAMASRGVDASILNQVSPASAGGAPPIPVSPPSTSQSASLVVPNATSNNPQSVQGASAPSGEAEVIIKALTDRLKSISKSENIGIGSMMPPTSY